MFGSKASEASRCGTSSVGNVCSAAMGARSWLLTTASQPNWPQLAFRPLGRARDMPKSSESGHGDMPHGGCLVLRQAALVTLSSMDAVRMERDIFSSSAAISACAGAAKWEAGLALLAALQQQARSGGLGVWRAGVTNSWVWAFVLSQCGD